MNAEHTLIAYPINIEQQNVLRAFLKALKIKFEVPQESPYNKDFVNMVLRADDNIKEGKGTKVSSEEFDNLWK
jgi:hypothetical protein